MDVNTLMQAAATTLVAIAWKTVGGVALWLLGRWLIGFALRLLRRSLAAQTFDPTLSKYLATGLAASCPI